MPMPASMRSTRRAASRKPPAGRSSWSAVLSWAARPQRWLRADLAAMKRDIKGCRSERLQECEKVGLWFPRLGMRGLDPCMLPEGLHSFALHLQVRRDVSVGRSDACVTEVVADHRHVGTRLQQCDGTTVAHHMRSDSLTCERWAVPRNC